MEVVESKVEFPKVVKRSGEVVGFDISSVVLSINMAAMDTGEFGIMEAEAIAKDITRELRCDDGVTRPNIHVDEILNLIERRLAADHFETAKAFITYRDEKRRIRESKSSINIDVVNNYTGRMDWKVKENSNADYSLLGLNYFLVNNIISEYWLKKIYPDKVARAHKNGDIHIHDLGMLSGYCMGWDTFRFLNQGFGGIDTKLNSSPPKHFDTALRQLVDLLYTLQSEHAGAQALNDFDMYLAPYVRIDGLTQEQVDYHIRNFVTALNVPTRMHFQATFSNITLAIKPSSHYAENKVVAAGRIQDYTYLDLQEEMDMINKAVCKVLIDGDKTGAPFTFPIPTYNITPDFDFDSGVGKAIIKMTATRGSAYFQNLISTGMKPDDVRSFCCRLQLDMRKFRRGGLFSSHVLTGSTGVVTVNLPRIACLSKGNKEKFFKLLDNVMDLASKSLHIKRKFVEINCDRGLYPYTKHWLSKVKEKHGQYFARHFSTIGLVGGNECTLTFMGKPLVDDEATDFMCEVLDHMKGRCDYYTKLYGHTYNLEATPAEGASYRLYLLDKKKFGDKIKTVSEYYTNSTHLDVSSDLDVMSMIEKREKTEKYYTGGCVVHIFTEDEFVGDTNGAIGKFIKHVFNNHKIPYITITPTFSNCIRHGRIPGKHFKCPKCGRDALVYSRVVGYYRPVQNYNAGKQAEFDRRASFSVGDDV